MSEQARERMTSRRALAFVHTEIGRVRASNVRWSELRELVQHIETDTGIEAPPQRGVPGRVPASMSPRRV